jgi:hypothetical protein
MRLLGSVKLRCAPSGGPSFAARCGWLVLLLDSLPEPNTNWAVEGRAKWLQAAARCFDLMYKGSGEVQVSAIPEPEDKQS